MKRIVLIAALVLFTASILLFNFYGGDLRSLLAAEVVCMSANYKIYGERAYIYIPSEALHTDENGMTYVFSVTSSDQYRETAYVVSKAEVTVIHEEDGSVYVRSNDLSSGGWVVTEWEKELNAGDIVRISD